MPSLLRLALGFAFTLAAAAPATLHAQDIRIGIGADVTSIDPHFVNLFPNNNVAQHVFDTLVMLDPDSRLIPGLAESWRTVAPTTWEFRLRRGVKFHDGTDLTADDVAFTIGRVAQVPNSPGPFTVYTKAIERIEVVDPHTLRFHTGTPYPLLANDLSTIYIVSRRHGNGATTADYDSGKAMIGSGPFRFGSYRRGDRVELVRNDAYWGPRPPWQRVTFRIIPNDPTRIAALLSGDVDAIENIPTADLAKLKSNPAFVTSQKVSHRVIFFHVDSNRDQTPFVFDRKTGKPLDRNPLKDVRVRQAISKAIDRNAIRDRVMEGLALPTANLVPAPMFGHNPDLVPEPYDLEGARRLLAAAGWPEGFAMTIHGPNNRYVNDDQIVQAVAAMLTRAGIVTKVETMPMGVYLGRASKLDFSFALLGWGASTGEASSPLRSHLATFNAAKGMGGFAWGRYSNPKYDAVLEEALRTVDDRRREALFREAAAIGIGELGIIPIHHQISTWATKKSIAYTPRTDEYTYAHQFRPQ